MTVTITTGLSTTKKSAQSKKCRLLSKVRDGMNPKVAAAIRKADPMLADVLTEDEIAAAVRGERKGRGGNSGTVQLEVEVD